MVRSVIEPTAGEIADSLCAALDGDYHDGLNANISASVTAQPSPGYARASVTLNDPDNGEQIARYRVVVRRLEDGEDL
jgi:hypothetical protein